MRLSLALILLSSTLASTGCIVHTHDYGDGGGGPVGGGGGGGQVLDGAEPLGLRAMLGYHVSAGAASALPDGDIGYVVTANGQGGYRVSWSDTYGSPAHFSGTITTDGVFDPSQFSGLSGAEYLSMSADQRTISFDSVPGSNFDGVDLVSSTDPIYVDATVDGSHYGFSMYFTGADTHQVLTSSYDPVAFTSP
jgi:hypothetical protein